MFLPLTQRSEVSLKGKNLRLWCYSWHQMGSSCMLSVSFGWLLIGSVEENLSMNELRKIHTSHVHVPSDKQIQVYILRVSEFIVLSLQVPRFLHVVWDCSCVSRYDSCPKTCLCVIGYQWKKGTVSIFESSFDRMFFSLRYVIMPE